jgi:hypothetical protein
MVVNVVRSETWLLVQEAFVLGTREVCKLQHPFWPPARILDVSGHVRYGLRWTTASLDIECWILELPTKHTLAKFCGRYVGEVLHFQPVELSGGELVLNFFDKPASFHPVGPGRWTIHFGSLPDPVSVRLFEDKRLKGQLASRVPMTICDMALSWLLVSTIARGIPEVYLPFSMH